jgi:hypothetical protein
VYSSEVEFLDEIQTKVLKVFLLAIHSHLYNFALRFILLQTHATSLTISTSQLLYCNVKEKGGKPDRKPNPLPNGLRNLCRNLKSENFQDYAQKPQRNCTFINSTSVFLLRWSRGGGGVKRCRQFGLSSEHHLYTV